MNFEVTLGDWTESLGPWLVPIVIFIVLGGCGLLNLAAMRSTDARLRYRLRALAALLGVVGFVAAILAIPDDWVSRENQLQFLGIFLSIVVALSSTTFIGNTMAGLMLRSLGAFRIGDYISVESHFGMVSERGLIHTEIQTEGGDLTTLPNLYLVTHPVNVVRRKETTFITTSLSLGYDVPHRQVQELLEQAVKRSGLETPFVQVAELGDFSVTYRVAGKLEDVKDVLTHKSKLNACILDTLHEANVEVVSPTFMNQRRLAEARKVVPESEGPEVSPVPSAAESAENVVFDKAEEAVELEAKGEELVGLNEQLVRLRDEMKGAGDDDRVRLEIRIAHVEQRCASVELEVKELEAQRAEEK